MITHLRTLTVALIAVAGTRAVAQAPQGGPAVRSLGPIIAASRDSVRAPLVVRALPNGSVYVAEMMRRRVLYFDSTLTSPTISIDSATAAFTSSLIPYGRDSTLYVDLAVSALLVLDDHGKVAHVMSLPRTADVGYVSGGVAYGMPFVDAQGRLVYRSNYRPPPGSQLFGPVVATMLAATSDSAPIVRADFDRRTIDTITAIESMPTTRFTGARFDSSGPRKTLVLKQTWNPLAGTDTWLGMPDGSLAIVRTHDYHVDFIGADGSMRSGPKLPFTWQRLTDTDKARVVEMTKPSYEQMAAAVLTTGYAIQTSLGTIRRAQEIDPPVPDRLPDYVPPIVGNTAHVDPDGNIWLVPRGASAVIANGLLYDVINAKGELAERVRIPAGRWLSGFGPGGVAYLTSTTSGMTKIEVAKIR